MANSFCDSPIWVYTNNILTCLTNELFIQNPDISWNTFNPSLTSCFRLTILPLISLTVLYLASFYDLYFVLKKWKNSKPVPWQWRLHINFVNNLNLIYKCLIYLFFVDNCCDIISHYIFSIDSIILAIFYQSKKSFIKSHI